MHFNYLAKAQGFLPLHQVEVAPNDEFIKQWVDQAKDPILALTNGALPSRDANNKST